MPNPSPPTRHRLGASLLPALFLISTTTIACGGGAAAAAPPSVPQSASPRPERAAPDSVWVNFRPEEPDQHWSLLADDETLLCQLPCARWVSPTGGAFLQYERPGTTRAIRVSVPSELGANPGGTAIAIARPENPTGGLGTKFILGGISVALLGVILFPFLSSRGGDSSIVALGIAIGAGVPLLGVGLYARSRSHPADVVLRAASSSPDPAARTANGSESTSFVFGPGFIAAETSPTGARVLLTPFGLAGTF
jgi:hypothetical protein